MIDVNGSRYHLMLGERDWRPFVGSYGPLDWDPVRSMVTLHPEIKKFSTAEGDNIPTADTRRGADSDRFGHIYWIDQPETGINVMPVHDQEARKLWSSADLPDHTDHGHTQGAFRPVESPLPQLLELRGLAVTTLNYLVVGVVEPAGLLIFDLYGGGPPTQLIWPSELDPPFAPLDIAAGPDGGIFVLDEYDRFWALDRTFQVLAAVEAPDSSPPPYDFHPEGSQQPYVRECKTVDEITNEAAFDISETASGAVAISALPDNTVLILAPDLTAPDAYSHVVRYRFDQKVGETISLRDQMLSKNTFNDEDQEKVFQYRPHDMAVIVDTVSEQGVTTGSLFVAGGEGNQAYEFLLKATSTTWSLEIESSYLPMRRYSGVGLVSGISRASYHTLFNTWLPITGQPPPRYETQATIILGPFDGRDRDCVWHRLFLDACIPDGTTIVVETHASNSERLLEDAIWQPEPDLYLRHSGSELPYTQSFSEKERKTAGTGTWELLFQDAVGRHLEIRLTLIGGGRLTPRIRALRAYYPRFSYAQEYLPSAYHYDPESFSFIDRFLANPEGLLTAIEGHIAEAQNLFDVDTVPEEYLGWLGQWLGLVLDEEWDNERRRLLLRHAMELFVQRGTVPGLIRAIRLATDECPDEALFSENVNNPMSGRRTVRIVERYATRTHGHVLLGEPDITLTPGLKSEDEPWTPKDGATVLHERYREFLIQKYAPDEDEATSLAVITDAWGSAHSSLRQIEFSPLIPANAAEAEDWRAFRIEGLGFPFAPLTDAEDSRQAYQAFLAQRYRHIAALKDAYGSGSPVPDAFYKIELPTRLPSGGQPLSDWIDFVSVVLPIQMHAHHFTILIPTNVRTDNLTAIEERQNIVSRIVEREKPAHTSFDVRPYWAMFRLGEARVGYDTVIDEGSRFVAMILGQAYLGEGYLPAEAPWNIEDRFVAGRNQFGQSIQL